MSPLRKSTGNWIAVDRAGRTDYKYYMNICGPLVLGKEKGGEDKSNGNAKLLLTLMLILMLILMLTFMLI